MVVDAYNGGRGLFDRLTKHLPGVHQSIARGAGSDLDETDQPIPAVEAQNPKLLYTEPQANGPAKFGDSGGFIP